MKYIGEKAIKKLISLIKGDLATKQPTITASGLLKGDGAGTISTAETQEATLVDVPNGLLKGNGTTISAAVAGTDYAAASHNHDSSYLKLSGGKLTGNLTGKYITGTWLQTTEATALGSATTKICVLDSSGWVYYRTLADFKDDLSLNIAFTVTLPASGWNNKAQTISNAKFVASGYAYTVIPDSNSFLTCNAAVIYADNVTEAGKMTFHCVETPTENLTMNILRTEVSE